MSDPRDDAKDGPSWWTRTYVREVARGIAEVAFPVVLFLIAVMVGTVVLGVMWLLVTALAPLWSSMSVNQSTQSAFFVVGFALWLVITGLLLVRILRLLRPLTNALDHVPSPTPQRTDERPDEEPVTTAPVVDQTLADEASRAITLGPPRGAVVGAATGARLLVDVLYGGLVGAVVPWVAVQMPASTTSLDPVLASTAFILAGPVIAGVSRTASEWLLNRGGIWIGWVGHGIVAAVAAFLTFWVSIVGVMIVLG